VIPPPVLPPSPPPPPQQELSREQMLREQRDHIARMQAIRHLTHFNPIPTSFQRHFNDVYSTFSRHSNAITLPAFNPPVQAQQQGTSGPIGVPAIDRLSSDPA